MEPRTISVTNNFIHEGIIRKNLLFPWSFFGFLKKYNQWGFSNNKGDFENLSIIDIRGGNADSVIEKIKKKGFIVLTEKNTKKHPTNSKVENISKKDLREENKKLKDLVELQRKELLELSEYRMRYEKVFSINKELERTIDNFTSVIGNLSDQIRHWKWLKK